jgi:hypothetical protein
MYSIDRLIEFGLGMGIAQQMVKSMNFALQNTYMPGVHAGAFQAPPTFSYFCVLEGKQAGPFSAEDLTKMLTRGTVNRQTLLWRQGLPRWDIAQNIPDVLKLVALMPPPLPSSTGETA